METDHQKNNRIVPVLAGGGVRLPAHVGALAALEELELRFEHLVGASGGSIVAALYAAGWKTPDLRELAVGMDFNSFRGFSLSELMLRGGLCSGHYFETWLNRRLENRRFCDLDLNLHVVATDVRHSRPVLFDRERTPDMLVARAVRFSMGIPLLFSFQE